MAALGKEKSRQPLALLPPATRRTLLAHGYPEIKHVTGRHIHDGGALLAPRWERYGEAPYHLLEANQVFTLEPTVVRSPKPSMLVEENVRVTAEGAAWLSLRQEEL